MSVVDLPGLRFDLGESIAMLRESVREFAQREIAPRAAEIDRSDRFPMDLWPKMGALGGSAHRVRGTAARRGGIPRNVAMRNFALLQPSGLSTAPTRTLRTIFTAMAGSQRASTCRSSSRRDIVRLARVRQPVDVSEEASRRRKAIATFERNQDVDHKGPDADVS